MRHSTKKVKYYNETEGCKNLDKLPTPTIMNKVKVPMDFGVENLQCPVHNNIKLMVSNNEDVRANSLILSYNSAVFYDIFFKRLQTSVDVSSFTKSRVDNFVKCLYSGKLNVDHDSFRELCELADKFSVDWLIERCDIFYMEVADSISFDVMEDAELFKIIKFSFDEASCAPKRSRKKYKLKVNEKVSTMKVVKKQQFIQKYATKYLYLSVDQLNALLELAKGSDGILLKIIQENVVRQGYHLDENSVHILKNVNLENCLEYDMDGFNEFFGTTLNNRSIKGHKDLNDIVGLGVEATKRVVERKPSVLSKVKSYIGLVVPLPVHQNPANLTTTANTCILDDQEFKCILDDYISYADRLKKSLISGRNLTDKLQDLTRIPNLFQTYQSLDIMKTCSDHNGNTFYSLQDILDAGSNSPHIKSLYMLLELTFDLGCPYNWFVASPGKPTKSYLQSIVARLISIKTFRGWGCVSPKFFIPKFPTVSTSSEFSDDLLTSRSDYPDPTLCFKFLLKECVELVNVTDSVEITCQRGFNVNRGNRRVVHPDIIRMGEFLSGSNEECLRRFYKFYWKHPKIKSCPNPDQCGFIISVTPINGTSMSDDFDIGLSTDVEDYNEDIHFHSEVMSSNNMHFVLKREFRSRDSYNLYVSWVDKPKIYTWTDPNHIEWKESIPLAGYITPIVYYDSSESD